MMNLLARILSHGFALAVVALIILVLMYRGELFEDLDLPDFLALKGQTGSSAETDTGTVDRRGDESATSADTAAVSAPEPEPTEVAAATGSAITASTDDQSASEVSVAETDPAAVTEPLIAATPAEDTAAAASDEIASEVPAQTEATSEVPTASEASTTQMADDAVVSPEGAPDAPLADDIPALAATTEDAAETTPATADVPDTALEMTPAAAEVTDTVPETTPAAAEVTDTVPETTSPAAEVSDAASGTIPAAAEVTDTAPATVAVEPPAAPPATVVPPSQSVDDTAPETPYAVLAKAREAYWLRDFETAEQQYRLLTRVDPDNPDGYGEMGNMYFSQGKWDEAAAAYYEAATRLLNEGLIVQARQMLEVIRGLNGSQADTLETQINAVSTASP